MTGTQMTGTHTGSADVPTSTASRQDGRIRRARVRRQVGVVVLQMAAIVFSILFALLLDEWRQSAQRSATTSAVLEAVRAEAEANRAALASAVEHHASMIGDLRSGGIAMARVPLDQIPVDPADGNGLAAAFAEQAWQENGFRLTGAEARRLDDGRWSLIYDQGRFTLEVDGDLLVVRGTGNIRLAPPFLTNASWQTAQITQVAVDLPPQLIALLTRIEQLHHQVEGTTNRLVDMIYGFSRVDGTWDGFFISALGDLVSFERSMIETYDELLALLGNP
jgi:hypothetical protein